MLGSELTHVHWLRVTFCCLHVAVTQLQQPLCVLGDTTEEEMRGQSVPTPSVVECDSCREPGPGITSYSLIDYPSVQLFTALQGSIRPLLAIVLMGNEHVGVCMCMCVQACVLGSGVFSELTPPISAFSCLSEQECREQERALP